MAVKSIAAGLSRCGLRTNGVCAGPEVSNRPQEFQCVLLLLQRIGVGIAGSQQLQLGGLQLHLQFLAPVKSLLDGVMHSDLILLLFVPDRSWLKGSCVGPARHGSSRLDD